MAAVANLSLNHNRQVAGNVRVAQIIKANSVVGVEKDSRHQTNGHVLAVQKMQVGFVVVAVKPNHKLLI